MVLLLPLFHYEILHDTLIICETKTLLFYAQNSQLSTKLITQHPSISNWTYTSNLNTHQINSNFHQTTNCFHIKKITKWITNPFIHTTYPRNPNNIILPESIHIKNQWVPDSSIRPPLWHNPRLRTYELKSEFNTYGNARSEKGR